MSRRAAPKGNAAVRSAEAYDIRRRAVSQVNAAAQCAKVLP